MSSTKAQKWAQKLMQIPIAGASNPVTGETVSIPAGAAGSLVNFNLAFGMIANAALNDLGGFGDSSLSAFSGALTTEVYFGKPDADLANGEYYVDYLTGKGRGKKASTATSVSATYSYRTLKVQSTRSFTPSATDGLSRDVSAALEASSVTSAAPALLASGYILIDETAATDIYYLQFFNSTTVPADTASATSIISPIPINHTNGIPTKVDFSFLEENGIFFSVGISWAISTTQFTKTVAGNVASGTIFYKPQ